VFGKDVAAPAASSCCRMARMPALMTVHSCVQSSTALNAAKSQKYINLQDLLPRITYFLFLYRRDNLHQHLQDRFLQQDRSSFALFLPGILAVQSSPTHPGLPRGPRVCRSPRLCSLRSRWPPTVLCLTAAPFLAGPGRSCQLGIFRIRRDLRGRLLRRPKEQRNQQCAGL